jgi:hypothetical protein
MHGGACALTGCSLDKAGASNLPHLQYVSKIVEGDSKSAALRALVANKEDMTKSVEDIIHSIMRHRGFEITHEEDLPRILAALTPQLAGDVVSKMQLYGSTTTFSSNYKEWAATLRWLFACASVSEDTTDLHAGIIVTAIGGIQDHELKASLMEKWNTERTSINSLAKLLKHIEDMIKFVETAVSAVADGCALMPEIAAAVARRLVLLTKEYLHKRAADTKPTYAEQAAQPAAAQSTARPVYTGARSSSWGKRGTHLPGTCTKCAPFGLPSSHETSACFYKDDTAQQMRAHADQRRARAESGSKRGTPPVPTPKKAAGATPRESEAEARLVAHDGGVPGGDMAALTDSLKAGSGFP